MAEEKKKRKSAKDKMIEEIQAMSPKDFNTCFMAYAQKWMATNKAKVEKKAYNDAKKAKEKAEALIAQYEAAHPTKK